MVRENLISMFFSMAFCCNSFAGAISDEVRAGIEQLASQMPMTVDEFTTVTSVLLVSDRDIVYRYAFDLDKSISIAAKSKNLTPAELTKLYAQEFGGVNVFLKAWGDQYIYPAMRNSNCSNSRVIYFMDNGYKLVHIVSDPHGKFLYKVIISKSNC
ncbi:hypothetical protein ACUTAF_15355 [Pseudomonas sp. SP16.1]|uniref:hypothetical protein n=1 Tax=Pseudomonas sp. SP16.1 TaxID=3458854 RepID=UPI004045B19A